VGAAAGRGRLIVHGPRDPRFNMACDEALGLCAREPVLRFYGWGPPALSLGYFQDAAEVEPFRGRLGSPPVVRRITGGGAIYHYRELTYSIVAPPGCLPLPADTAASYRFLHAPFIAVLNGMGIPARDRALREGKKRVPACFDSITAFDVTVGERKILGSAQRRHRRFFLQHGSLPLEPNPFAERATSVSEEAGRHVEAGELIPSLVEAFSRVLGVRFEPSDVTEEEEAVIARLVEEMEERVYGRRKRRGENA